MLPVFIGIGACIVRFYSVFVPGFPALLKLGLAGGPLIMLDPRAYRQYRQAVLVYATKR